jgi:hypothetical protein
MQGSDELQTVISESNGKGEKITKYKKEYLNAGDLALSASTKLTTPYMVNSFT